MNKETNVSISKDIKREIWFATHTNSFEWCELKSHCLGKVVIDSQGNLTKFTNLDNSTKKDIFSCFLTNDEMTDIKNLYNELENAKKKIISIIGKSEENLTCEFDLDKAAKYFIKEKVSQENVILFLEKFRWEIRQKDLTKRYSNKYIKKEDTKVDWAGNRIKDGKYSVLQNIMVKDIMDSQYNPWIRTQAFLNCDYFIKNPERKKHVLNSKCNHKYKTMKPLSIAIDYGRLGLVKVLVNHGALIHRKSIKIALKKGQQDIIKYFYEEKDVSLKSEKKVLGITYRKSDEDLISKK